MGTEVMFGKPGAVEAQLVGEADLLDRFTVDFFMTAAAIEPGNAGYDTDLHAIHALKLVCTVP
jgi:hypothetical protein